MSLGDFLQVCMYIEKSEHIQKVIRPLTVK